MKRSMVFVLAAMFIGYVPLSHAEEASTQPAAKGGMMGMSESSMHGGMMGMHKKMMGMKMHKKIVATRDGGVVVMSGNKLLKYDKFLNLKKETELPMEMCGMMKEKKDGCPMMDEDDKTDKGDSKASESKSGHESHHKPEK